ncbi:hypothetical protein L9F63_018338, partial [Diploptera punctata]
DLCFWRDVTYQVYENSPEIKLGPVGPGFVHRICPQQYSISYNITSGTKYVKLKDETLWSKANLDRDAMPNQATGDEGPGPEFDVTIECVVDRGLSLKETVTKSIRVLVLDEDDNAPVPQDNNNPIHVPRNVGELKKTTSIISYCFKELMIKDRNAVSVDWDLRVKRKLYKCHLHMQFSEMSFNTIIE